MFRKVGEVEGREKSEGITSMVGAVTRNVSVKELGVDDAGVEVTGI
ncbi:hypothetical protein COLO4_22321 [Corchorus olitorius]|uniref:Uncharacterized protein n=1 Tax=Corchorus olitorius TaxID=93759 RepID=A0A1R3IMV1_9ROSI|nr:hypothetical protein COLO4_22321 [Corchorus olitorius]